MGISTSKKAFLQAQLTIKLAQLEVANATYLEALKQQTESYKFNSNEGSQQTIRRKLEDLRKAIDDLENDIESLENRLAGKGIVNMNLRRKHYGI